MSANLSLQTCRCWLLKSLLPVVLLLSTSLSTKVIAAGLPPAGQVVPPGFNVIDEQNLGGMMLIKATKPNENFPKPHQDFGITLECTWSQNPMAAQIVEILAQAPEDPVDTSNGILIEPCGRQRHRGGVLSCRKTTRPWVGGGDGPDLVIYSIGWVGAVPDGQVGVSVSHFAGSKSTAIGWIDAIIPKLLAGQ